ncbi:MAG: FRG domain-containing protein [Rhodospirillaceae bacterium]|nr:FRG domain-containing protein [Rhodospirillaceae bacterium]
MLAELKLRSRLKQPVWYRGQGNAEWGLVPTIARENGGITAESPLITRFKQNALGLLEDRPTNEWEWLFVMRHYGVPTRLLDWSESPLVALFFAATFEPNRDGAVWCLLPIELNKDANIRPPHPSEIPGFGDAEVLNNYLPSSLAKEQTSSLTPAAAIAPRNTRRIQAQHGVFTITHRNQMAVERLGNGQHIWKLVIPASAKQTLVAELSSLNVSQLSLFPELDHVAMHAKELLG